MGFFYDLLHLPNGDAVRMKIAPWWGCFRCVRRVYSSRAHLRIIPELSNWLNCSVKRHPEVVSKIRSR